MARGYEVHEVPSHSAASFPTAKHLVTDRHDTAYRLLSLPTPASPWFHHTAGSVVADAVGTTAAVANMNDTAAITHPFRCVRTAPYQRRVLPAHIILLAHKRDDSTDQPWGRQSA